MARHSLKGFTLIELSIVLVIVGLIVGGVLVGRDLIKAASLRATIVQIDQYQLAVNTFREKTGYLPGDIPAGPALTFGLSARGGYEGEGDGNFMIEGMLNTNWSNSNCGICLSMGEIPVVWKDLGAMKLIGGNFAAASTNVIPPSSILGSAIDSYMPAAKMGNGNYIYVFSSGSLNSGTWVGTGTNYFGLSAITAIGGLGKPYANPGLTASQANNIDGKIDDGLPQKGRVLAIFLDGNTGLMGPVWVGATSTTATPGSSTTCYDNGNVAGTQLYSVTQNSGEGMNCALSFQFH